MSTDLALAADPTFIERHADPGVFILEACERAKTWLHEALEHGDIDQIAELKSQADAVRIYTVSKQLGKDAQLSATEIVRRAERGIGVAIRRGQEAGEIRSKGQGRLTNQRGNTMPIRSPSEFATDDELRGNDAGIYGMTDGLSDEDFEEALEEARAEKNLSRANLVRKAQARKSPDTQPVRPAPSPRRPRRDPLAGTLLNCVIQLQGTIERLELELQDGLDDSVTPEIAGGWADDLTGVIRPLSRLRLLLKEKANG